MKRGRPSESDEGSGQQKTVWFTPENLVKIHRQIVAAGGTSFNKAVNSLVESGAPDAVEIDMKRAGEIQELRRVDAEKDRIIKRLQGDLDSLKKNSISGQDSLGRLEEDLLSVHPKSRNRIAKKLGLAGMRQ
jgi:hypothetical protein